MLPHKVPIRYSSLCAISLLVGVWIGCAVSDVFAQVDYDDITVSPELYPSGNTVHGYAEYRIAVSNRSSDKTHQVTLMLPESSYGYETHIRKMARSVVVAPSTTVRISLFQPPVQMHGSRLGVTIDGKMQEENVPLSISDHGRQVHLHRIPRPSMGTHLSVTNLRPQVLISRDVNTTELHTHAGIFFGPLSPSSSSPSTVPFSSSSSGPMPYEIVDLGFPVSSWSTSWLGFSSFDGVVVTGDAIRRMPPDVQFALWRYVECGGSLFVLGGRELPEQWGLKMLPKSELSTPAAGLTLYDVGFGECIVSSQMDTAELNHDQWSQVMASWLRTATPWRWEGLSGDVNNIFPVVDSLGIPVRGLYFLMLLFALTVGPVNLIVLSRKKRRIWMLWTTPVISLITCLAVFAYATFSEGWKRHIRTEGLTILDEKTHRATTIGRTAFYSALIPSEGLHFGYETELTPTPQSMTTNTARTVDWTQDQHLASGWITARVPSDFMVRKSEVRRERITVRRGTDAGLRIVNGLGADISELWLADIDGTIYSGDDISAGEEAKLIPFERVRLEKPDENFLFEMSSASTYQALDKGNDSDALRYVMATHDVQLSSDLTVAIKQPGYHWRIMDLQWGRAYDIKGHEDGESLRIYVERRYNLRGIFASDDWLKAIEHLKTEPEEYLRPGCYIATLETSPFIEKGLQKVSEERYSSTVYGILAKE